MRYPLFAYMKLTGRNDDGSKIFCLLENPYLTHAWQPHEVTEMVFERLIRDRPIHVVDAVKLQNRLHRRYGSRKDVVSSTDVGMVKLKMMPYGEKRAWCYNYDYVASDPLKKKVRLAVQQREKAWERLGKKKKDELEKNRELRELFFLTNELKGMLSA